MTYSVVIASHDREDYLRDTVADWGNQEAKPSRLVIVFGGTSPGPAYQEQLRALCEFPVEFLESPVPSAAKQRNSGFEHTDSDLVVFCDDDVQFDKNLAAEMLSFFAREPDALGALPRMRGYGHRAPGPLLKAYYRMQAGFYDETYGARLFGPGISCYPCWEKQEAPVESNWLPSTLLWMKAEAFRAAKFPDFEGYSLGEDAYLTHSVWRRARARGGKLFFLSQPTFEHLYVQSGVKSRRYKLGRMAARNQKRIAREAMGLGAWEVFWKLLAHRVFMVVYHLKARRKGWGSELAGWWSSW